MTRLLEFFDFVLRLKYYIFIYLLQRKVEFKMKRELFFINLRKEKEKGENVKKKKKNERWPRYIHEGHSVSSARVQKYRYFQKENEAACRGECVAKLKLSISWKKVDCPMTANISRGAYL